MKILVVVPAYNEEITIRNVVYLITKYQPGIDVLVINDGSSDQTHAMAENAGAQVIDLPYNLGIGGAVQTGFIWALRNKYDIVIQVDGDGQHNPYYLERLIQAVKENEADVIIGSRFIIDTGYKGSKIRKLGISFFSNLLAFICESNYFDPTSGFRALNSKALKIFAEYYPSDYPEVESIVYGLKQGLRIKEIPVAMKARQGGNSSITPLKSVYYMFKVTVMLFCKQRRI